MRDIKICSLRINARNELSYKVIIKEWDYSVQEQEVLKQAEVNGDTLYMEITWLSLQDNDKKRKSDLNWLHCLMDSYAEKTNKKVEELIQEMYKKYKVKSRTEMRDEDLMNEIENYSLYLREFF